MVRWQPCKSPVWDTAIAVRALAASGVAADSPSLERATRWLLEKEVVRPGDWAETVDVQPGGWYFEYHNEFYPDCDDTAMVLMALATRFGAAAGGNVKDQENNKVRTFRVGDCHPERSEGSHAMRPPTAAEGRCFAALSMTKTSAASCFSPEPPLEATISIDGIAAAIDRGLHWLLAMQNDDGGWGAFDRNNNRQFLCYIPFADHNAMIDPSTPDLSARVLEALGGLGQRVGDAVVDRAVAYLRRSQEPDGSWYGRWGVNYIYGTWQALAGLAAVGVADDDPAVAAGAHWLLAHQQPSGAWGESADSYAEPSLRGQGPPTASQTAWALLGLLAAGRARHPAVGRGIGYLVRAQQDDGTWAEREFTGTGFPRVFYLRYHYYPIYFPLMALSQWAGKVEGCDFHSL
jgi:squalene-hopene/tetraprenyl-beta-curcumene cyclase